MGESDKLMSNNRDFSPTPSINPSRYLYWRSMTITERRCRRDRCNMRKRRMKRVKRSERLKLRTCGSVAKSKEVSKHTIPLLYVKLNFTDVGWTLVSDLTSFRRALLLLQSQVDDLDRIKADFYQEVLEGEEENWNVIAGKVALIVRSQIDAADRIVTKGTSDSIIESMVQSIPDPFNAYGQPSEEGHIFSILPPLGIASPASSNASPQHPATGLARSKFSHTNSSSSVLENSPATTARWAQEQQKQRLAGSGAGGNEDDADRTPKRERKDRLSWISENEEQRDLTSSLRNAGNNHLLGTSPEEEENETERQPSPIEPLTSDNGW